MGTGRISPSLRELCVLTILLLGCMLAFATPPLGVGNEPEPQRLSVLIVDGMNIADGGTVFCVRSPRGIGSATIHREVWPEKVRLRLHLRGLEELTVQYARWGWRELEPQPGKIAYDFLDKVLKESHESGQTLAFRVMCCSPYKGPFLPSRLAQGPRRAGTHGGPQRRRPVPNTGHGRSGHPGSPPRFHQTAGRAVRRPPRPRPHEIVLSFRIFEARHIHSLPQRHRNTQ